MEEEIYTEIFENSEQRISDDPDVNEYVKHVLFFMVKWNCSLEQDTEGQRNRDRWSETEE